MTIKDNPYHGRMKSKGMITVLSASNPPPVIGELEKPSHAKCPKVTFQICGKWKHVGYTDSFCRLFNDT
jgi:hypothetical protein